MELIQKYIYQIYKEKSFSSAAKTLYVSQPALSAAVARFEKEMGIKIFDRTKKPLSLTQQGIIYIETLEEIMSLENNMQRRFRELSDMSYGSLSVGGSSYASYAIMTKMATAFYKKYPHIKTIIDLGNIGVRDILSEKLLKGELDLVISYIKNNDKFIYETLTQDRLIIAMHKNLIKNKVLIPYTMSFDELCAGNPEKEISDLTLFKNTPFVSYENNSLTAKAMSQMFGTYKTMPCTIKNARHSEMHYNLMCEGFSAVVIPDLPLIHSHTHDDDIVYFVPSSKEFTRKLYLVRTHMTDNSPIISNYVKLAKELFPERQ